MNLIIDDDLRDILSGLQEGVFVSTGQLGPAVTRYATLYRDNIVYLFPVLEVEKFAFCSWPWLSLCSLLCFGCL